MSGPEIANPILAEALDAFMPDWRSMGSGALRSRLAAMPWRREARLRVMVARRLFGLPFPRGRVLDSFLEAGGDEALSSARSTRLNLVFQPVLGVGPDFFTVNESMPDGMDAANMGTLLDWDRAQHDCNEAARAEAGDPRPYVGRMSCEWVRWIEGGELVYGFLGCAAGELSWSLWDAGQARAREIFPYRIYEGPDNGKPHDPARPDGLRIFDMRHEPEDAFRRSFDLVNWAGRETDRRQREWAAAAEASGPWADLRDDSKPDERRTIVTLSGPGALALVRPDGFLADLAALPGRPDGWIDYAEAQRKAFMEDLEAEAARIAAAASAD